MSATKEAVINLSNEAQAVAEWPTLPDTRLATLAKRAVESESARSGEPLDIDSAIGKRSHDGYEVVRIPIAAAANPTGQSALTVFYDSDGSIATIACAITMGIGCGVCLAAAIGGWSGIATGCVAVANTYS